MGAPMVLYEGKFDPRKNNKKVQAAVDLDKVSERAWAMLMAPGGSTTFDQPDSDKEYWDRERQVTINRVESLLSILREFQGIHITYFLYSLYKLLTYALSNY